MFDVPFEYGGGWTAAADEGPEPVIVISHKENQILFGGGNSVGRNILWNNTQFRIIGVLKDWSPQPKFYDLNNGPFDVPEDAYVPIGWGPSLQLLSGGSSNCWKPEPLDTFQDYMNSDCVWIEMWVELPDAQSPRTHPDLHGRLLERPARRGPLPAPPQESIDTASDSG